MSTPRVISGKARGLRLLDVPGDITRPITDRVKESLFNILGADIEEASMLDLFGGTGAVGIEALSRGAAYVRINDMNRAAIEVIKKNLAFTRLESGATVTRSDAFSLIKMPPDRSFDYIYVAPPQYKGMWAQAMRELDANPGWLIEDGWIIVQIHPREYEALDLNNFVQFDERKYGSTLLVFYQRPSTGSKSTLE